MPFGPLQAQDPFEQASQYSGGSPRPADGFAAAAIPGTSGINSRTGRLDSGVIGTNTRKLIHWLVPEGPIIEMYCNPQQIRYNYSKNISNQRTKGGFSIQYWGENLTTLDISGTTGTSGIEGMNVLHDIYRNEQLAFDPYALFLGAKNNQDTFAGDIFGIESAFSSGDGFLNALSGASEKSSPAASQGPTLASLATQVEMYWSGEVYRGYFESFAITERAENLGLFDYEMKFTATQKRGIRRNFLGWHRSATAGPSNSNPDFGPAHTFGGILNGFNAPPQRAGPATLSEGFSKIVDGFESTGKAIAGIF